MGGGLPSIVREHGEELVFETLLKMFSQLRLRKLNCRRINTFTTAFATVNNPQSFPPICFWHRRTVTSISLSGPVAMGPYTLAIWLLNEGVRVVFDES